MVYREVYSVRRKRLLRLGASQYAVYWLCSALRATLDKSLSNTYSKGGGGGGKEAHDHVSSSYKTINEGYVRLTLFRNRNTYQ